MRHLLLILILLAGPGCAHLKDKTGAFVSEAVVDHIAEKIDAKLEHRGLSLSAIKSITDLNGDGRVDLDEVKATARLAVGDLVTAKADTFARQQRADWKEATKNLVTRDEATGLKGDVKDFWLWLKATIGMLFGTIGSYLTKQVFSAKSDGKRDAAIAKSEARMDALERLTGRDLNNDGQIGSNGGPATGEA
jgi:hypothetical protein